MKTQSDAHRPETAEQFGAFLAENGMNLPVRENAQPLREPHELGGKTIPNRICIQPLEGFDSGEDGAPTGFVRRRYRRFAESGAGLVWFESAAVAADGKSNPRQMMLSRENLTAFSDLISDMDRISLETNGYRQYKVLQLTHSGRVSRDGNWLPAPVAARRRKTDPDTVPAADDGRIYRLIKETAEHAVMAKEAGFDAVDIKACHGYFLSELLGAREREGAFGGSFENRTRALLMILDQIREKLGDTLGLTVRLNAFDAEPGTWGLREENGALIPDLSETVKLCSILRDRGVEIINISASSPSQSLFAENPGPAAREFAQAYDLLCAVREIRSRVPGVRFVYTGLSSFRKFGPAVGAGGISAGWFDFAGFGRQALAYPEFSRLTLSGEPMEDGKCCVQCGNCFRLMNPGHSQVGCIVRDPDPYAAFYRERVLGKP